MSTEKAIIAQALKDKKIPAHRSQEYLLLEHPSGVTLLVDLKPVGSGSSGSFYKAFYLDQDELYNVGIKNINAENFRQQELEVEQVLYPEKTLEPMTLSNGSMAIFKPFLPGKTLGKIPPSQLAQLKLSDIFGLITQFTDQIKQLHAANFSHNDLKPENILVDLDATPPKLYIIDCGVSNKATHTHALEDYHWIGNPIYFPPETLNIEGWYGIHPEDIKNTKTRIGKPSDVYMATSVMLNLLGAQDPFKGKELNEKDLLSQEGMKSRIFTPFSSKGFIDFPKKFPPEMREFISHFIARTQHIDYAKRPSIEEVSAFFHAAENLALKCEEPSFDIEKNIYLAQMSLIDAGLWNQTLEKYDFQANPEVCDAIVSLMKCGKQALIENRELVAILTRNSQSSQELAQGIIELGKDLRAIVNSSYSKNFIAAVKNLEKEESLEKNIVIALRNGELCEAIAQQTPASKAKPPSSNLYSTLLPPSLPGENEYKKNSILTEDTKATSTPTELYNTLASGVSDNTKIKELIDTCPNLNWQDEYGNTALHLAVENGDIETIEALIEANAHLNIQNTKGETPLHWAITQDDYATITTLIETKKVRLDLKDQLGNDAATLLKSKDFQGIYADFLKTPSDNKHSSASSTAKEDINQYTSPSLSPIS